MLPYLTLATLFLTFSITTQKRISELEICQRNLHKVITDYQNLITTINNVVPINPENYLLLPSNCADLLKVGNAESGVYTIYPKSWNGTLTEELSVFCDMETDGGGWIVFQRRADYEPRQNFFQDWETYKRGFGQLDKEFWLGNENIYVLTNQESVTLRVDFEDFEDETRRIATYDNFTVANCQQKYKLAIGNYNGNAGDSLRHHENMPFSTFDKDSSPGNCTARAKGAWWYNNCYTSNLNGVYKRGPGDRDDWESVTWRNNKGLQYSLKKSEMKIRPSDFAKSNVINF